MKLSDYAKQMGVRYETAWRWFRDGKIQGRRIGLHTIMMTEGQEQSATAVSQRVAVSRRVAVYARVSSSKNQSTLDSQAKRLVVYCAARGYQVAKVITEIGSGINDARPKLLALLAVQRVGLHVAEQPARLPRDTLRCREAH